MCLCLAPKVAVLYEQTLLVVVVVVQRKGSETKFINFILKEQTSQYLKFPSEIIFFPASFGFVVWSIWTFPSVCLDARGVLGRGTFLLRHFSRWCICGSAVPNIVVSSADPSAAVRSSATWWQSFKIKPSLVKWGFELNWLTCASPQQISV